MNAPVVQWQIVGSDPDAIAGFYGAVLGWTNQRDNKLGYRQIPAGDGGIPGGVWPAPAGTNAFVQLFVRVENPDQTVAAAMANGATVIVPVTVLPEGDVMAVIRDPFGMSVGLVGPRVATA